MGERIALAESPFIGDLFIPARKRYRLKGNKGDFLGIIHGELDNRPHLIVVHAIEQRCHQHDVDAGIVQIVYGSELDIKQIGDLAMAVRVVAYSVKLKIYIAQPGFIRPLCQGLVLRKLDAVGRSLDAVESDLPGIGNCINEVRGDRGFAARKLHGHLAARLYRHGPIENFFHFFPVQLANKTDLVGVREAGITHHVAAIREVHGQNRTASILHGARPVIMQRIVVVSLDIAARIEIFDALLKFAVQRQNVFEFTVDGTFLHHPYLSVPFENGCLDLPDPLLYHGPVIYFILENLLARFYHALWTKRIGGAGKAQRRLGFLTGFQQRFIRPFGNERRMLTPGKKADDIECHSCCNSEDFLQIFYRPMHFHLSSTYMRNTSRCGRSVPAIKITCTTG